MDVILKYDSYIFDMDGVLVKNKRNSYLLVARKYTNPIRGLGCQRIN